MAMVMTNPAKKMKRKPNEGINLGHVLAQGINVQETKIVAMVQGAGTTDEYIIGVESTHHTETIADAMLRDSRETAHPLSIEIVDRDIVTAGKYFSLNFVRSIENHQFHKSQLVSDHLNVIVETVADRVQSPVARAVQHPVSVMKSAVIRIHGVDRSRLMKRIRTNH